MDIDAIIAGCNAIDNVAETIMYYADDFSRQSSKLDKDTFSIDGETMHGVNMDYYIYFSNVYSNIKESTQNIRNVALSQYNKIQNELNETAKKQDLAAGNSK